MHTKLCDSQPRMFAIGGERCPVALSKQFVSRRLQNLKRTDPFYLSIKTNRKPDDNVWFKVQPIGENKINDMMKSIVAGTIRESSDKKFTNHGACLQNSCEQIEGSKCPVVGDCKGHRAQEHVSHWTRQTKTNGDSFRMPFQGRITLIHNRQYPEKSMASKSCLPLQFYFFNCREHKCHCNRFRCSTYQRLDFEHFQLLPGFIQLQELQVFKASHSE